MGGCRATAGTPRSRGGRARSSQQQRPPSATATACSAAPLTARRGMSGGCGCAGLCFSMLCGHTHVRGTEEKKMRKEGKKKNRCLNTQPCNDSNLLSKFVVRVCLHERHLVWLWLGLVASHLSSSSAPQQSKHQRRRKKNEAFTHTHPETPVSVKKKTRSTKPTPTHTHKQT